MTSRFNGEDLVKRSLFVSLIGLKKKQKEESPKQETYNPWSRFNANNFDEATEPCSTKRMQERDKNISERHQSPYGLLTDQMQDVLLTSPHDVLLSSPPPPDTPNVASPHDIYQEIVTECATLEQSQYFDKQVPNQTLSWAPELPQYPVLQDNSCPPPCYTPVPEPLICPNCHYITNPVTFPHAELNSIRIPSRVNGITIEELVKMIISSLKNSESTEESKESPEETLRRKRQQNNAAAARYRKRQREEKMTSSSEFEEMSQRNKVLRTQIGQIQKEMAMLREHILTMK
ncbi:unnamed protein product [Bursaphelenchus xylophilus]|uniref:(pine wood nematode) hypothetical protein n=1 Tax=Bursaphelenchus xylophilus TaxID=6326 RepID=A0A1I7S377_BURXY|nr:unnamed protein product [Bursaphelenchus xylophilus]CAG9116122.1 unnamed protein product [Bursaphelenchus xylophilus]